jgi:hypothetical protein
LGGESTDDRAHASRVFYAQGDVSSWLNVGNPEITFADDPHQGVAWHRPSGDWYSVDNNVIRRFDAAGAPLASNTDPSGDVEDFLGMATLGHCCAPCIAGDLLIVPVNNYPTDTLCAIAVFNRETLALINAVNVSAVEPKISGICWNDETSRLVTCNWGAFTNLYRFTLNEGTGAIATDGDITLTQTGPGNLTDAAQGIVWRFGHYWIADDSRDETIRIKPSGAYHRDDAPINFADDNSTSVTGNYEGNTPYKDGIATLVDPTSADAYAIYSRPANFAFGGGGARYGTNNGYFQSVGLSGGTTWTIAISAKRTTSKQATMINFRDLSAGTTNDRAGIVQRLVTGECRIEAWDNTNTWLTPGTTVVADEGEWNRVALVYSGTTRKLVINGVVAATQTGITARDAGFTALTIGHDDESDLESFDGDLAFGYLRMEALSDAWLAAEYANLSDPAGFGTLTED